MKKSFSPLLILSLALLACSQPPPEQTKDKRFHITAPSLLYFKNMRSTAYEESTQPGTRIELYRLRRFSETDERPILYPIIANNWLEDQAYLYLRANEYEKGYARPIRIRWPEGGDTLHASNREEQYRFALNIYEQLKEGKELKVLSQDSTFVPIYENRQDRSHYLTTVQDYLRLTENSGQWAVGSRQ